MEGRLELRQEQRLVLTAEMSQALAILRMSGHEIEEWLGKELTENPLLEWANEAPRLSAFLSGARVQSSAESSISNFAIEDYWQGEDLASHLKEQVEFLRTLPKELQTGALRMIEFLDDNGYLRMDTEGVAVNLGISHQLALQSLMTIQSLEPAGVGARNLSECLLLQIKREEDFPKLGEVLVTNLEQLATVNLATLAKELGSDLEEIRQAVNAIRSLNPKPGQGFGQARFSNRIIPDIEVQKAEGEWRAILSERTTPALKISPSYQKFLESDDEAGTFARERFRRALWVIRSLDQRKQTLQKVADYIVRCQKLFLDQGKKSLQGLTLSEIAAEVQVHPSTVSRAIAGKWLNSPQGLFPLKYFLSSGLPAQASHTGTLSRRAIQEMIRHGLLLESAHRPWSDAVIARWLNDQGIQIARRTVTKYREELGISNAAGRRRE